MVNLSRSFSVCALILGLGGTGLLAQTTGAQSTGTQSSGTQSTGAQPSGTSTSTSPSKPENKGTFVRRFSAGATLSVLGLNMITGGSSTVNNTNEISTAYSTSNASQRIGYGLSAQAAITDHFALAVGAYLRHMGYQFTTTVTTTTPTVEGSTVVNITSTTSTHEDTRSRILDFPVTVRYYKKNRHTPGGRWFAEGGFAWRDAANIRTSIDSTDNNGTLTCCTHTPTQPAHKNARGYVAGAGLQFIDPFGIRVVPEVRYTRWTNQIFNAFTTHTAANQVEICLTLAY